jgi:hypothetical protein
VVIVERKKLFSIFRLMNKRSALALLEENADTCFHLDKALPVYPAAQILYC